MSGERSADFQSAVSPICNRLRSQNSMTPGLRYPGGMQFRDTAERSAAATCAKRLGVRQSPALSSAWLFRRRRVTDIRRRSTMGKRQGTAALQDASRRLQVAPFRLLENPRGLSDFHRYQEIATQRYASQ